MKFRTAPVLAITALVFSSMLVSAQQAPPESETLSSTTELVLVPAQVKGHDGKPLLGLKQEDFVLRSDGKPQPIRVFEETMQSPAKPSARSAAATAPLPDRISNVPSGGMPDQILIIALDLVNTAFLDQTRAKQQLLKYLQEQAPNQHFALVAITKDGLAQIHNFSSDPAVLVQALERVQGSTSIDQAMHRPQYQTRAAGNTISPADYNDDAIKVLSSATGGKSCTANAGLKDCVDEAVADSSSYYLLGFYVPQQERKPGWHKLEVKLVSERGSVRSRSSYYLASATSPSDKEINRTLRDAASAKIGYTGLAFTVERESHGDASPPAIRVRVPASSVLLTAGHPQLSYDIVSVPLTSKGEPAADLRVVHLNLTEEQTQNALSKGWSFTDQPQGGGTKAVKYVLRDSGTGRIGSVIVPPQQKTGG